ncbi:MAG: TRAP transporter small permease subunit [Cellvibrionaceae bacterium]
MLKLLSISEKVSSWLARIGGLLLLACVGLIVTEVFLRKFFNYSIQGTDELSGYALSISLALSLPYALLKRAHIRVDALYNVFPYKFSAVLDWVSILSMNIFALFLLYSSYDVVHSSLRFESTSNTLLSTPLWIPQSVWFVGFIAFAITCFIILTLSTIYLAKGEFQNIKELIGGKSVQEELEEEISHAKN